MSFHNTTDNPSLYEDPAEREEARRRDPIDRVVKYLRQKGLWDEAAESQTRAGIRAQIDETFERATRFPAVTPGDLFEHAYAELPDYLHRQRDQLLGDGDQT
jgi:pyruvate dehydrogenase E1 component alpha subunit